MYMLFQWKGSYHPLPSDFDPGERVWSYFFFFFFFLQNEHKGWGNDYLDLLRCEF